MIEGAEIGSHTLERFFPIQTGGEVGIKGGDETGAIVGAVTFSGFLLGGLSGGAEVGAFDLDTTVGGLEEGGERFEEVAVIADKVGR
jgi:hypothetical protein